MTNELVKTPDQGNYINTVELDATGKKTVANAINNAVSLADFEGVEIKVCNVLTMPGVRKSRQKDIPDTMCQNTYLVDVDGNAYFSQSDGVARSINGIMSIFPDFPRDTENGEFAPMALVSKTLANGNTIKTIKLV